MKIRHFAFLVGLAATSWAQAQMSQSLNAPSINQRFGASPSTPPQMFQTPPSKAAPSAPLPNSIPTPAALPDAAAPAVSGNIPAAPAVITPAPSISSYNGGDLTNVPMPETMEQIDNKRELTVNDQIVFQVLEDHNKPQIMFVDEEGAVNVPYLSQPAAHVKVEGSTLYEVAKGIKQLLEDPTQVPPDPNQTPEDAKIGLYKHATVLMAFFKGNGSRGQVNIFGEVNHPGAVDVPANNVLTLLQAIQAAGGFKDASADKEHVQLIHHILHAANQNGQAGITQTEINFQKFFDGVSPEPNFVVQPGDFIKVPSKSERAADDIIVNGEVRSPTVLPPPGNKPLYLSEVMLQVGFTDWSNHNVQLIRFKDGKKTVEEHDVDDVLIKGNKDKDVQLQAGDFIYVKRNWYSF